jgi:hypothetical protein
MRACGPARVSGLVEKTRMPAALPRGAIPIGSVV